MSVDITHDIAVLGEVVADLLGEEPTADDFRRLATAALVLAAATARAGEVEATGESDEDGAENFAASARVAWSCAPQAVRAVDHGERVEFEPC